MFFSRDIEYAAEYNYKYFSSFLAKYLKIQCVTENLITWKGLKNKLQIRAMEEAMRKWFLEYS